MILLLWATTGVQVLIAIVCHLSARDTWESTSQVSGSLPFDIIGEVGSLPFDIIGAIQHARYISYVSLLTISYVCLL
jgi:hypothetical protein